MLLSVCRLSGWLNFNTGSIRRSHLLMFALRGSSLVTMLRSLTTLHMEVIPAGANTHMLAMLQNNLVCIQCRPLILCLLNPYGQHFSWKMCMIIGFKLRGKF